MKRTMLAGIALCMAALCQAAMPTVESVEKVALPDGMTVAAATLSPDGSFAVVTPLSGSGLQRLDLGNGKVTEISKTGSQMMLQISEDGNTVVFRESSYDQNHRRYVALKSFNFNNGSATTLVEPSRNLQGFVLDGNQAVAVDNGRKQIKTVAGIDKSSVGRVALSISQGKLFVTDPSGNTFEIAPLGKECGSYLWPVLSPDGTKIAAFGVGTGTFVCDLAGNNVKVLGMYRAPQWLDNNTIVAMDDYDNGVKTIKSSIVALNADGSEKSVLTSDDVVAVFPSASQNKVAFTTPDGELYIMNLKK